MNYSYNLEINFQYPLIDLFEWNKEDKILSIKKIPIYRIEEKDLKIIKYNKICFIALLNEIKNKTQLQNNKYLAYSCLLCDDSEVLAIKLNKDGLCISKSHLKIDKELDILDNYLYMKYTDIKYEIIDKDEQLINYTRKEIKSITSIIEIINNMEENIDKINFLYYEMFNKYPSNNVKEELIRELNHPNTEICNKINDFLELTSLNKN